MSQFDEDNQQYSVDGFPVPRNPASADKKKITQLEWLMPDYESQKQNQKTNGGTREIGDLAKELEATALDGEEIPELKISTAITEGAIWPSTAPEPASEQKQEQEQEYEPAAEIPEEEPAGISFRDHNAGNLNIPELPRSLEAENQESEKPESTIFSAGTESKPQNRSGYSKEALASIPTPQLKTLEMKAPSRKVSRMPRGFMAPEEADLPKGSGPDLPPSRKGKLPTEIEQIFQGRMGKVVAIIGASVIAGFVIGTCFLASIQKPNQNATALEKRNSESPVNVPPPSLGILNLGPKAFKTAEEALSHGESYLQGKKYKEAYDAFSAAVKLAPDKYDGYARRGLSLYLLKDYKGALTDLNQALSSNSRYLPALYDRAATYFALGDYSHAQIDYALILAIEPGNTQALLGQALCKSQEGQSEACLKALRHITQENPQEALAHRLAGEEFLKQEDYERAVSAFSKAIEAQAAKQDTKDKDVLLALRARAYIMSGNKQAALRDLDEAIKINPSNKDYKHDKEVAERELP